MCEWLKWWQIASIPTCPEEHPPRDSSVAACGAALHNTVWHSTAESSVITTEHEGTLQRTLLKYSYSHVNQCSTVRRSRAQLRALLATETVWLLQQGKKFRSSPCTYSAGNTQLLISYSCEMTEQERCGPGASALLRDAQPQFLFPKSQLRLCPAAQGDAPPPWPGGPGLPPPQSLRGRALE